ncbi:serine/threonine protein kinase [Fibrobacter sp.]|uniref:serine/threonine protein kinase n=1 Tax=Fibrobacter sp. TaxID=35828 RepID=UPI00388F8D46
MSFFQGISRCETLHSGGEAQIYKLWNGSRTYALKWYGEGISVDSKAIELLQSNRFDGVFRVLETGVRSRRPYMVYDYIEGVVSDKLSPMSLAVALRSLRLVVRALQSMSRAGVHHGDLNPSNIVFGLDGRPVLIDCGIVGPGTLAFAAPERIQGAKADEKSDLYSLGLLLYRWIAGEDLLKADSFDGFAEAGASIDSIDPNALLFGKFDTLSNLGGDVSCLSKLSPIWKGLLRVDPEDRVEDFDELDELLEIAFDGICGAVAWENENVRFQKIIAEKNGTDCRGEENFGIILPEFAEKKVFWTTKKLLLLSIFVVVLSCVVLFLVLNTGSSGVDETGAQMLLKSRAIEQGLQTESVDSGTASLPENVLESLPMPGLDSSVNENE